MNTSSNTILQDYSKYVRENKEIHCKKHILCIEYIEHIMSLENVIYIPERTEWFWNFIENHCWKESGNKLTFHQKYFIACAFSITYEDRISVFSEVFYLVTRGDGKSELLSAIYIAMYFAIGKSTKHFYNFAYTKDQAKEISDSTVRMLEQENFVEEGFRVFGKNSNQFIKNENIPGFKSEIKPTDEATLNGLKLTGGILDEVATWKKTTEYNTIRDSMKDEESKMISITTAGHVDNGVYDYLMERTDVILDKNNWEEEIVDDLFPFIFQIDDFENWSDINEIRKANPSWNYPHFKTRKKTILKLRKEILSGFGDRAEFFTKSLNVKVAGNDAFFQNELLVSESAVDLKDYESNSIYSWIGGLDLGDNDDFTSFSMVCYDADRDKFIIWNKSWMCKDAYNYHLHRRTAPLDKWVDKGWLEITGDKNINNEKVMNQIIDLREKYDIVHLAYDPSKMNRFIQTLNNGGFITKKVFTNATFMNEPMSQAREYVNKGDFDLLGNECLRWQLSNVIAEVDSTAQERMRPKKAVKQLKIDAAVSTFTAMSRRLTLVKGGVISSDY